MERHIARFCRVVFDYYAQEGRKTLPWRLNTEPWGVLISEYMLQQTQIERVIPFWERWTERWPSPAALAAAPLADALREWNGLGYNRRARQLWECARRLAEEHSGRVPRAPDELIGLPGIGPYCAGAVACFAYNYPSVFIETNIRAALLSFFFEGRGAVHDRELFPILEKALDKKHARLWYWALMDYGAAIKKSRTNPGRQSAHYSRQSAFHGSFRQARGAVLRALIDSGPASARLLAGRSGVEGELFTRAAASLEKDRLVRLQNGLYMISPEK
jgi:A/G-specific adenine glycosylase